jgi:tRNA pseudouridine55 synthase
MREALNGVVVVDKPLGPTSFAIVRQARIITGVRKIGHGGTLDPAASGVLPICFGEATKVAQFLLDADKQYDATITFGVATDSYDATGTVTQRRPAGHLTAADVEAALAGFRGWIEQRPPIYSALKRAGRPLYELARAGEDVEIVPRRVRIDSLELTAFEPRADGEPRARLMVSCSKGTYIRSLAHDLGAALRVGGSLHALRRTRSGPFRIEDAIAPEALGTAAAVLISPADALRGLSRVILSPEHARALTQGQVVLWRDLGPLDPGEGPVRLLDAEGNLVAVAPRAEPAERVRTQRVFHPGGEGDATQETASPHAPDIGLV